MTCAQVEKLLEEVDASNAAGGGTVSSPEALDSRVRLYERVASEVSRLNFHAAKGASLPFVQQLAPRIQTATTKLKVRGRLCSTQETWPVMGSRIARMMGVHEFPLSVSEHSDGTRSYAECAHRQVWVVPSYVHVHEPLSSAQPPHVHGRAAAQAALDVGLHAALRSGGSTTVNHALHAYAAIGDPAGAERAVREVLVAPAVAGVLDEQKGASADALPAVCPCPFAAS